MKRGCIAGWISILIFTLFLFTSCGRPTTVPASGRDSVVFDEASEKVPQGAGEKPAGTGPAGMMTGSALEWPRWVPDCVPEYRYGSLFMAQKMEENGSGMLYFHDITTKGDPFMDYMEDLTRAGWEEELDWVFDIPEEEGKVIAMQKEDCFLVYTLVTQGEMSAQLTISTGIDFGQGGDRNMLEEDIIIDNDDIQATISGSRIPEGYPHDFCPLYQPSEVALAMEIAMDDEGFVGFTIGLHTQDSIDQVKAFYLAQDPDEFTDMGTLAVFVFLSEDEMDSATVTLMADVEGEDPDFETSIILGVGMKK